MNSAVAAASYRFAWRTASASGDFRTLCDRGSAEPAWADGNRGACSYIKSPRSKETQPQQLGTIGGLSVAGQVGLVPVRRNEACIVDVEVLLDLVELNDGADGGLGCRAAEKNLGAVNGAVIGVIDLRRIFTERTA